MGESVGGAIGGGGGVVGGGVADCEWWGGWCDAALVEVADRDEVRVEVVEEVTGGGRWEKRLPLMLLSCPDSSGCLSITAAMLLALRYVAL